MAQDAQAAEDKGGKGEAFLATARKRFKLALDAFDDDRRWQLDDVKFYAGTPDNQWQWPEDVRTARGPKPGRPARPTLTINKLPQHVRLITNEQRQNRPSIKVLPVDDKGDVEVADVLNGIIRHIEAISDADIAYDHGGENQVKHGEGYWRILSDYCDEMSFDQDLYIRMVRNSFSVYMDPDGLRRDSTGRYIDWCFITDELQKDEFKRQFPKAKETDWELLGQGDDLQPWTDGDKIRIAEYFYVEREKKKIILWADDSVTLEGEMPKVAGMVHVKERETTIRKICWVKMSGLEVLEERDWPGKYIPVVRCIGNEEEVEGKTLISGIVRNAKDPQRMVNYWTSQEAEMLALAPKAPFVGAVGQFETDGANWGAANVENLPYLQYDLKDVNGTIVPPPARQMPPMPPAGFISAKLGAGDDLQSVVGQYNPSLGAEAKEKSGVAIKARQRQADVGTFHYIDNQARSIRQTGRILIDLIPKYYDTRRVARILGEDGTPDHVTIDPDQSTATAKVTDEQGGIEKIYNPTIGQYDVRVTTGPSYTTKRQEAAEFMAQILQGNKELMGVMGDLYFRMLDVPGAEEIAERIKKTLPPNLAADDSEGEQEPTVQTPHGPIPLSAASQMIGELTQGVAELQDQLKQVDAAKAQKEALDADSKNKSLEIDAAKLEIDMYNAQTQRLKVTGELNADEASHSLATAEHLVESVLGAGALHQKDEAMRLEHERASVAEQNKAAQPQPQETQ